MSQFQERPLQDHFHNQSFGCSILKLVLGLLDAKGACIYGSSMLDSRQITQHLFSVGVGHCEKVLRCFDQMQFEGLNGANLPAS